MPSIKLCRRSLGATLVAAGALLSILVLPAGAAAVVYPPGGGAFSAGAEGWEATEEDCNVTLLSSCTASGEHDAASGNPAGSLIAKTSVTLNVAATFDSTVVFESPDFTVAETGAAALHLDRQLATEGLLTLAPEATYTVAAIDRGTETPTEVLEETIDNGDSAFAGKDAVASVVAGHTYAIAITVETTSLAAIGLLGGSTSARFDNVALSIEGASGGEEEDTTGSDGKDGASGGDGSAGPAALSESELRTLVRRGDPANAQLLGRRVFVRLRCPKRAQRACRIVAQGRIKRRVPVTQRRAVRIAKGRSRLVGLNVKARYREKVAQRKRLLVVQRVRVGRVTATYARSRPLIRRQG